MSKAVRDEEDDDDEKLSSRKQTKKQLPRFIKNSMENVNPQQIVVNLSKTHYDIIETVVEELGWVVETSSKSEKWDIMWTDWHIEAQDLFRLNDHQKISHFPAIYVLAKKNFLGRSLMKMNKAFPQDYNYFPSTWSVPAEIGEVMRYDSQVQEQQIYIFKPEASSQGKGILLISKIEQLEGKTGIVQLYVNNPLLIDNLKFDMRIYVLIYSCDPLRIYIYQEGLARFATEKYQKAKKKNMKDNFIHLTNYAINKTNKKFVFNTSELNMNIGHKRSLTSVFTLLKKRGADVESIKKEIDRLIVKTLLVGKPMLEHMYGLSQTDNLTNDHCFQILGFDVLLNDALHPILLQVNHTPSFATDTPLDKTIKKNLIKETLLLLNVNITTKQSKIQKKMEFQEMRSQRKISKLTTEERIEQKRLIELEKNQYEAQTLNKFRRIFPSQTNQYSEFEKYAFKIFNEQAGFKNKQASSSFKNSNHIRPVSLQNIPSSTKLKKKLFVAQSTSHLIQQQLIQKLPDISPKKSVFLKSFATPPHRVLLKNYEFSPDKAFAEVKQKYTKRLKCSQKIVDKVATVDSKQKVSSGKKGKYIEPKTLKINQIPTSKYYKDEFQDEGQKPQKNIRRTFLDFVLMSTRQKNMASHEKANGLFRDKELSESINEMKLAKSNRMRNGLLENIIQNEIFPMKSLTLNKRRVFNQ